MCTPDNIPEFCSCPYVTRHLARVCARVIAAVAAVVVVWLVIAAGYAWTLALAAWLALMGVAALVAQGRRRLPIRAAGTIRTRTAGSRPPATAPAPARTAARDSLR